MAKRKWAAEMKAGSKQSFKTSLEKGPTHVVQSLIGIFGTTEDEVINMIVKNWMSQNIDMLARYNIDLQALNNTSVINRFNDA